MMTMGVFTAASPVRTAAPLPPLRVCRRRVTFGLPLKPPATSNVPSVEQSSTTTTCPTAGWRRTRPSTWPRVAASLNAGIMTPSRPVDDKDPASVSVVKSLRRNLAQ